MNVEEARKLLIEADDEEPVVIPMDILAQLKLDDVPEGVSIQIGTLKDSVIQLDWDGQLYRTCTVFNAEAEYIHTRKYWYSTLGLEQYMDLIRRAVETRQRLRKDVELSNWNDDGAFIQLTYIIKTGQANPAKAFEIARSISGELEQAAESAADDVGKRIAEVASRLSGWGSDPLEVLVEKVETAITNDDKGRSLEELMSRLFEQVPGFSVTGRIRTETEEIDISILNDSTEPRLRRESALLLAECKNWNGRCGKDEFVIFHQKLENRNRRSSLGFLISWNGFTSTLTKEMLRGSREGTLIVPITGEDVRGAVRSGDFLKQLVACWDKAVTL
jgi:hypothetical protein